MASPVPKEVAGGLAPLENFSPPWKNVLDKVKITVFLIVLTNVMQF